MVFIIYTLLKYTKWQKEIKNMNEKEMRTLVRDCLNQYHKEDKKILIDISVIQIMSIPYILYNLIFFGNKIYLSKETFESLHKVKNKKITTKREEIVEKNASYILEAIQRDEQTDYHNYTIIDMNEYGTTKKGRIKNFLLQNSNCIFYLANYELYESLKTTRVESQLNFLTMGMVEANPFRSKEFKFETIGAIQFKDEKMFIVPRETNLIKVYNSKGIKKEDNEVNPRNYILIRGNKEEKYSFSLYQVVSKHTRNHAIRMIWTDLKKGEKSNKYIDRLPYQYRKMILDNVK